MTAPTFGSTLRAMRVPRRITQSKLAERAHLNHSYVSRLESGLRTPTRDAVERISTALTLAQAERETLLHAAGYISADDPALLQDDDLRDLAAVLTSEQLPPDFRRSLRLAVQGLVEGARIMQREVAA